MFYRHVTYHNFAIIIRLADGSSTEAVIHDQTRVGAIAKAFRGLPKGGKVVFCKAERDMTNDELGRWGMPTYRAPAQPMASYANLDLY